MNKLPVRPVEVVQYHNPWVGAIMLWPVLGEVGIPNAVSAFVCYN